MKVDLKKQIPAYTAPRGSFAVIDVPPQRYLMIDGHGDPNTSATYRDAIAAIYPLAYKLKFFSKKELDRDYTVMPLEALWWADDMTSFTTGRDKSQWNWTLLNLVPEWLTDEHIEHARSAAARKGAIPLLDQVRVAELAEGTCVQTLHVGPFDDEGPVLDRMHHEFIPSQGLRMTGRHHEIYFSDLRRADPSTLRTILRQPVERVPVERVPVERVPVEGAQVPS